MLSHTYADSHTNDRQPMDRSTAPTDRSERRFPTPDELQALVQQSVEEALESASLGDERGPDKDWLTNQEVMDYLDLSRATLRRHRDAGRLPYAKIGQRIYYHMDDIEDLLERNRR